MIERSVDPTVGYRRVKHADVPGMADDTGGLRTEMIALQQYLAGVVTRQEHDRGDLASLRAASRASLLR